MPEQATLHQPFAVLTTVTAVPFFSSARMEEEVLASERRFTLEEHFTVPAVPVVEVTVFDGAMAVPAELLASVI